MERIITDTLTIAGDIVLLFAREEGSAYEAIVYPHEAREEVEDVVNRYNQTGALDIYQSGMSVTIYPEAVVVSTVDFGLRRNPQLQQVKEL